MSLKEWVKEKDFWKSDEEEWQEIYDQFLFHDFTENEILEILDSIIGLTKQEYGE